MLLRFARWFTRSGFDGGASRASSEVIGLRLIGLGYLVVFVATTATTRPQPSLHGRGLVVAIAMLAFVVAAVATQPRGCDTAQWRRIVPLGAVTAAGAVLAAIQPNGIWQAAPYFVGVVAAMRLDRLAAALVLAGCLAVLLTVSIAAGRGGSAPSVLLGAVPWFLVMRLMREMREQHLALLAAQAAEARGAADAERGRLAREMHDVLAHSLSALALQLESTRLLARERGAGAEVSRALEEAHHLAASGLDEARRAIAAARGDELPGPERLEALAEAFGEQSGVPVTLEVNGEPRDLAPDARLAVFRTAQEALTNVRRHAAAERVSLRLEYLPAATVLVVEDHATAGDAPPPVAVLESGYGLTGMRERAELLGGELRTAPTRDGFRVELRLPA